MTVPGGNLLTSAFSLICKQRIGLYRFTGRTTNEVGMDVRNYAPAVTVDASIQPVSVRDIEDRGLDYTRRYIGVWTPNDIEDLYRLRSGDQISWQGHRWEVVGDDEEWFPLDGWNRVICVRVPDPV